MEKVSSQKYFLVDNGSLRPESVFYMREVATRLEESIGVPIESFGIMHSHKIDISKLGGVRGMSMESFFISKEAEKCKHLRLLPMFIGPSLAITDWLYNKLTAWKQLGNDRTFLIADPLFRKGDQRITNALAEYIITLILENNKTKPFVVLVDHGTPLREVNHVREEIGKNLERKLTGLISGFSTACMERREGSQYDFNDPLLEKLLKEIISSGNSKVIIAQLFLGPGRHAGAHGDIAKICQPFIENGIQVERTPILGKHALILEILADRFREISRE